MLVSQQFFFICVVRTDSVVFVREDLDSIALSCVIAFSSVYGIFTSADFFSYLKILERKLGHRRSLNGVFR